MVEYDGVELLPVTAVRQFFYCKREPYYIYVVHTVEPSSETMAAGVDVHLDDPFQAFLRKIKPRLMFRSPRIRSVGLGLDGVPDYVFVTGFGEVVPAEVKYSGSVVGRVGLQFVAQLVAYALILEDGYLVLGDELVERGVGDSSISPLVVKRGVIYSAVQKRVVVVEITEGLKHSVRRGVEELKRIILTGEFPDVRQPWSKCSNCWYRRFCYPAGLDV
ncbi:MAG: Dna2/Cas4 domain-containing protein [Thermoprotei archaeon]